MSRNVDTTRITDLPENTQYGGLAEPIKVSRPREENSISASTTYQPLLDVYPNPYGVPKPATLPNFNESIPAIHHPLPQRDYPRDSIGYTQDEQIKVDYIPQQKLTNDFISQHNRMNQETWDDHRRKKHRLSKLDQLINELQTPFFITLLFFIFQLPSINSLLFKYFSFLSIHNIDTSLNAYGLIFKSLLFGLAYYFCLKTIDYFSE